MAVSSTATEITYAGNGSTVTPYVIPFAFLQTDHIEVEVDGVALGAGTFTVTRDSDGGGGFLRTEAAVAGTVELRILRVTPLTQPAVFQVAGPLPAKTLETSLDRLELQIQELVARVAFLEAGGVVPPTGTTFDSTDVTFDDTDHTLDET